MRKNKVSVVMCTYNGEKYVQRQLESILNQTISPSEIIICDDGSYDNTIEILKNFATSYSNIKIFLNKKNLGVIKNFYNCIQKATGEYVFLSDQDDIWEEKKVERYLEIFNTCSYVKYIFSDAFLIDETERELEGSLWEKVGFNKHYIRMFKAGKQLEVLIKGNVVTGATLAIRTYVLQNLPPFPQVFMHDYFISLALSSKYYKAGFALEEKLTKYRIHLNQNTGIPKKKNLKDYMILISDIKKGIKCKLLLDYIRDLEILAKSFKNEGDMNLYKLLISKQVFFCDRLEIRRGNLLSLTLNFRKYFKYLKKPVISILRDLVGGIVGECRKNIVEVEK